eukprot:403345103
MHIQNQKQKSFKVQGNISNAFKYQSALQSPIRFDIRDTLPTITSIRMQSKDRNERNLSQKSRRQSQERSDSGEYNQRPDFAQKYQFKKVNIIRKTGRVTSDSENIKISDKYTSSEFSISPNKIFNSSTNPSEKNDFKLKPMKPSPYVELKLNLPAQEEPSQKIDLFQAYQLQSLSEYNRARMVDWMIQVLQVFNQSSDKTLSLAISMMDRYYFAKWNQASNNILPREQYHLIGLTCIWIASKIEDVYPIKISQLIEEAAHGKFEGSSIIQQEADIIQTLNFKLYGNCIYEESVLLFLKSLDDYKRMKFTQPDIQHVLKSLRFLLKASMHSIQLSSDNSRIFILCIVLLAIEMLVDIMNKNKKIKGLKNLQNFDKKAQIQEFMSWLQQKHSLSIQSQDQFKTELEEKQNKVISNILEFQQKYKGLQNLKNDYESLFKLIKQQYPKEKILPFFDGQQ